MNFVFKNNNKNKRIKIIFLVFFHSVNPVTALIKEVAKLGGDFCDADIEKCVGEMFDSGKQYDNPAAILKELRKEVKIVLFLFLFVFLLFLKIYIYAYLLICRAMLSQALKSCCQQHRLRRRTLKR